MADSSACILPNRAEYLAPGGLGNDQWLIDYYAYINCINGKQDPSLVCPPGFVWYGSTPPNGGCLKGPMTQAEALAIDDITGGFTPFPVDAAGQPAVVAPPVAPPVHTPPKPAAAPPTSTATLQSTPSSGARAHYIGGGGYGDYCFFYPDDPYCDLWGDFGGLAGAIGGGTTITQTVIQQSGLLAADVHSIVDEALNGLWAAEVAILDVVLGGIVAGIQRAVTALGNALKATWNILSRLNGLMLHFLRAMWFDVVRGTLRALRDIAGILKDLYSKVLKPLLTSVQQLRAKLLDVYKRVIRPLLVVIQDVRKVLAVLAAFHVPFAKKLDQKLAQLEGKITAPLLLLLRYTNGVANWINLIVTAGNLLQKPIFLASLKAYVGSSINLQLNAMTKPLSAADLATLHENSTVQTPAQSSAAAVEYMQYGTGPNAAMANAQTALLTKYFAEGV